MPKRYSGEVTVNVKWNEEKRGYTAKVNAPGYSMLTLNIPGSYAPEGQKPISPKAYDEAAKEAITMAEEEFWGAGISEFAAHILEVVHVGRNRENRNPPRMTTMVLDTMNRKELMSFWSSVNRHAVRAAREFFPERPPKYVTVAESFGAYASNRAAMLECQRRGDKHGASCYEWICKNIKWSLPMWAN